MPDAKFTVPYPEHPHFVGREEDLARLHAALQGEGPVGINPAALGNPTGVTGQGGIGKTQLAVAYAYRYREDYPDGVYWLNAAESLWSEFANLGRHFLGQGGEGALKTRLYETLRTRFKVEEIRDLCFELGINYEEFSPQLGISSLARELVAYCQRHGKLDLLETAVRRLRGDLAQPQAQDELVIHAFTWLRGHPRSLLILDNVADPAALEQPLTRDCVPGRLPSRVLFTTRRRELGHFRPVELKTLPADAALRLLLRDPRRQPALDPAHPEHITAQDICATFGYLPLALEIAAAHLAKFPTAPLTVYRDELRRRGALDVMADPHVAVPTRHETGLTAALEAQWETLGEEARLVLRVAGQLPEAAYLPADRLGLLAGIRDLPADVPEEWHTFFVITLTGALRELQDTSLIEELAGDQVRLHPLVREFARDRTPLAEKADFRAACVRRLLDAFSDIKTLERQVDARGIDAILRDLLAARALLDGMGPEEALPDLGATLRVLRREAHNLRGWKWDGTPNFLAQRLHLRLFDSDTPSLFGDLVAHLRSQGRAWSVRWAAQSESLMPEMTLTGHDLEVITVAVTPDGRRAVSGGYDRTVRVWNLDTGETERVMVGHEGMVQAVAVTPDGHRAISGGADRTVRVWNLNTGETEWVMVGHEDMVQAVAVTPNGQRAVSGGYDRTVRVWNLDTGEAERTLIGHEGHVEVVAVTPDGQRAVSSGSDGTVFIWNLATGEPLRTLTGEGLVWAVAMTSDGRRAVSAKYDDTLWVRDFDSGREMRMLTRHKGAVTAVSVTPDGRRAVSAGYDRTLCVWDLDARHKSWKHTEHTKAMSAIAVMSDGRRALTAEDKTLRIWDLDTERETWAPAGHKGAVTAVSVTPDGRRAVSAGYDGTLRVWDLNTGREIRKLTRHIGRVRAAAITPDGRRAVSGGDDRTLRLWNLVTGREKRRLTFQAGVVDAVAMTLDGRWAVFGGGIEGRLQLWNLDTEREVRELSGGWGRVNIVAVTPDARRAVYAQSSEQLYLLELNTKRRFLLTGHKGRVRAVAVTPDGRRAVSGADDQTLRVWNLDTGKVERTIVGHEGGVGAVALTPDGRRAVSGGEDRTLRLWELDTGCELAHTAFDAAITCVAVAPGNPPLVVAGDATGSVYCLEWIE